MYWEVRGLGADIVALVNDTPETNAELRERLDLPFSLLSDPDAGISRLYNAFHNNEPKGRSIARIGVFLIDSGEHGGVIRWEYVSPTHHHRVPPSRLSQELQTLIGLQRQIVQVVIPSGDETFSDDANEQALRSGVTMGSYTELFRLRRDGWKLQAVSPEFRGATFTGQRYVFERDVT